MKLENSLRTVQNSSKNFDLEERVFFSENKPAI